MSRRIVAVAIVGAIAAAIAVAVGPAGPAVEDDPRPNIVVISVDSLRTDHMSAYGYRRNTTPEIAAFADDAVVFEEAISAGVYTLTSHGSMFTAQYPSVHGLRTPDDRLPGNRTTLAEALSRAGYMTGAFVGNNVTGGGHMKPMYGFAQGFDRYHARGLYLDTGFLAAQRWIEDKEDPFFAFIHGYDVHAPFRAVEPYRGRYSGNYTGVLRNYTLRYHPNRTRQVLDDLKRLNGGPAIEGDNRTVPLTARDMRYVRARYDETVLQMDARTGRFLRWLQERGLREDTVVVFVAPEGENLGDHVGTRSRLVGHELPFEHTVRVPLIVDVPGRDAGRISSQVSLLDLMPTLLELAGIDPGDDLRRQMQGRSFVAALDGSTNKTLRQYAYTEAYPTPSFAVRTERWKYIDMERVFGLESRLYDLRTDPGERRNLIDERPAIADRLEQRLDERRSANRYFLLRGGG